MMEQAERGSATVPAQEKPLKLCFSLMLPIILSVCLRDFLPLCSVAPRIRSRLLVLPAPQSNPAALGAFMMAHNHDLDQLCHPLPAFSAPLSSLWTPSGAFDNGLEGDGVSPFGLDLSRFHIINNLGTGSTDENDDDPLNLNKESADENNDPPNPNKDLPEPVEDYRPTHVNNGWFNPIILRGSVLRAKPSPFHIIDNLGTGLSTGIWTIPRTRTRTTSYP